MRNILRALCFIAIIFASATLYASTMRTAKVTAYCAKCSSPDITRSGKKLQSNYCAADPRYWKPGTVIKFGAPVNKSYTIEDTGSAIRGRDRFDLCLSVSGKCKCNGFGVKRVPYTVIKTSNRSW